MDRGLTAELECILCAELTSEFEFTRLPCCRVSICNSCFKKLEEMEKPVCPYCKKDSILLWENPDHRRRIVDINLAEKENKAMEFLVQAMKKSECQQKMRGLQRMLEGPEFCECRSQQHFEDILSSLSKYIQQLNRENIENIKTGILMNAEVQEDREIADFMID